MTELTHPRGLLVNLRLEGRRCVVVGSGEEAARRATLLDEIGALVVIAHSEDQAALGATLGPPRVSATGRCFHPSDLHGAWLAIVATEDETVAAEAAEAAEQQRVLCCVLDSPARSTFFNVARARSGPLTVGIASDGLVPALVRRLREELQRVLDEGKVDSFARDLARLRASTGGEQRALALREAVARIRLEGGFVIDAPARRA